MSTVPQSNIPTSSVLTVGQWFGSQAPRMRRTKFKKPWMLADELFLIFSRVPDTTTGPITIHSSDLTVAALDLPPIQSIDFPPLDLEAIDIPVPLPTTSKRESESGDTEVEHGQRKWIRLICVGKVTGGTGISYVVELYPNGLTEGTLPIPDCHALGLVESAAIPADTWVIAQRGQFVEMKTIITYDKDGVELSRRTEVSVLRSYCIFYSPVWLTAAT